MNTYQKQHYTPTDVIPAPRRMDFTLMQQFQDT